MKKSNKGFTLVELLAAIVIMGILILFAVPTIVDMVFNNRNKMYITDAKKLASQVEYIIRSSSSTIEKPAPNNAIIVSMKYLDDDGFETAPNRGKYLTDASYVVVKNNNGTLEYTVSLIEEMSSGKSSAYRGIELVKSEELNRNDAVKYVKTIKKEELKRAGQNIEADYINSYFRENNSYNTNYINKITKIYNKKSLRDAASKGGLESPVINKVTMISTSGKNFNSLDATLTVSATDEDTPSNKLTVYVSIDSPVEKSTEGFLYGDGDVFTKEYDLGKYGYNYENGDKAFIYVVVKDPDGNSAEKVLDYGIHINEGPVISDDSTITKLPNDSKNLTTGLLRLKVEDDIDTEEELEVCYTTDIDATSCSNYKKYNSEFSGNEKNYSFEINKCSLNGQTKNLKVFVKDSLGKTDSKTFSYTIYKNQAPTIENVSIESEEEPFTTTGSLDVRVKVKGSDDMTPEENLKVRIESGGTKKEYDYEPDTEYGLSLSGKYDGSTKDIKVTLIDECGLQASTTRKYTVYKNQSPKIEKIALSNTDYACNSMDLCPMQEIGNGNFEASVDLEITDDIDYDDLDNKILVCISEDVNACNLDGNYKKYSAYGDGITYDFSKSANNKYDGSTKTLYVVAKDSYDEKKTSSATYKLYKNQPPKINEISIVSKPSEFTTEADLNTTVYITGEDDLDDLSQMKYVITDGINKVEGDFKNYYKTVTVEDEDGNTVQEQQETGIDFKFSGNYDGKTRNLNVTVYDTYNASVSSSKNYTVFENQPPKIITEYEDASGEITNYPKISTTSIDGINVSKAKFEILASDDYEGEDNLKVNICYKEGKNGQEKCLGNKPYEDEYTIDFGVTKYTGQKFYVRAIVTDILGLSTSSEELEYVLYKDAAPEITSVAAIFEGGREDGTPSQVCLYDQENNKYYDKSGNETTQAIYQTICSNKVEYPSSTTEDDKLKVSFIVKDPYDTYKVCISESNTECNTYYGKENGEGFDGTTNLSNMLYYVVPKGIIYDKEGKNTMQVYYLFVKDSNGNIGVFKTEDESGNIETTEYYTFIGNQYEECASTERKIDDVKYTFQRGTKISAKACGGKCYYATQEDVNEQLKIVNSVEGATLDPAEALEVNVQTAFYQKVLTYKDRFNSDKTCPAKETQTDIEKDCSFRDCFYNEKKKSYDTKAIGLTKKVVPNNGTVTIQDGNGKVYESKKYFQIYLGSYDVDADQMIFNQTKYKVTSEAYLADDSIYKFNANSDDFYVRIRD